MKTCNLCSTLFFPHHFDFDQLSSSASSPSLRPAILRSWLNILSIASASSSSEEELNSIAAHIAIRMAPWTVLEHLRWDEVDGKVFQTISCPYTLGVCNVTLWIYELMTHHFKATHVNLSGNKCLQDTRFRQDHPAGLQRTNPRWVAQTPTLGSVEAPALSQCRINAIRQQKRSIMGHFKDQIKSQNTVKPNFL